MGAAAVVPTNKLDLGKSVNHASLLTQVTEKDGSSNQLTQTTYNYDETTPTPTSGLPHHSSGGSGGNITSTHQWINTDGSTLNTSATYDDAGTKLTSTDPNGATTYGHDVTDTFVTSVTPPTPSSGVALTGSSTVDTNTGLSTGSTDPNGTQAVPQSYDAFGRPIEIDIVNGGTTYGRTTYAYTTTQLTERDYQSPSRYAETQTLLDAYGRPSRAAVANGQSMYPWYQSDTCYDASGRTKFRSYPYQGTGFTPSKVCSGSGDTYSYDALGRVTTVTHADGTAVGNSYRGRAVQVTDENGVKRITQTDGLGRPIAVCEVSAVTLQSVPPVDCGSDVVGAGFLTRYSYDLANHKTTVSQGSQVRAFQTDSLGRTISVTEPESGTTTYSYAYNSTGLVVTRKHPKANPGSAGLLTTTTTQYDSLGRVVSVGYDDGLTPSKSFAYDTNASWAQTPTYMKGRLVSTGSGTGSTLTGSLFSYNAVGRVNNVWSCGPLTCGTSNQASRALSFSYDWTGNVTGRTDGVSGAISYGRSLAGEVTSVINQTYQGTGDPPTLVSNVVNGPFGPSSYHLGNGLNVVNSYDSLGRRWGGWVCNNGSTQSYCGNQSGSGQAYGFLVGMKGERVTSLCDTALGKCETIGYDDFNRQACLNVNSGTVLNLNWVYDRYGNRWQQNAPQGGPAPSFTFNSANNQILAAGYTYDGAGNMTNDGSHSYTYDAEGNILQVDSGATAKYVYDAQNHRVRVQTASSTYEYLFDNAGQRVSSWLQPSNSGNEGRIFWDGVQIAYRASNGQTFFEHQDYLGTERLRTDSTGAVAATDLSLPFGDGYSENVSLSYGDQDSHHFAQLDWDSESYTDHAHFRQYNPTQGRWLSPDPYSGSYDFLNPQSLNRYSYVRNSPLASADPSGLFTCNSCGDGGGGGDSSWIADFIDALAGLFGGGGPSFHGSNHPRPQGNGTPDYGNDPGGLGESLGIGNRVPRRNWGIAAALGLPDPGCEFGACGGGPSAFGPGIALAGAGTIACQFLEPCGVIEDVALGVGILGCAVGIADINHLSRGGKQNIVPSWAAGSQPLPGESASQFADLLCAAQYPPNGAGCGTGPGSERNKIRKWARDKFGI